MKSNESDEKLFQDVIHNVTDENHGNEIATDAIDDKEKKIQNKPSMRTKKKNQARKIVFIFSVIYSFFYTGSFYGWGPMQLLLEENGAFHSNCYQEENGFNIEDVHSFNEVCEQQTIKLINIQMIAQLNLMFAPVFGYISDIYGTTKIAHFMGVASITGWILFIISVLKHIDNLLYVAFFLQGSMTIASNTLMVQTAVLFPFEGKGLTTHRVTAILNSSFDAGAITYLGLWSFKKHVLRDSFSNSLEITIGIYLGFAILVFAGNSYFWEVVVCHDAIIKNANIDDSNVINSIEVEPIENPSFINNSYNNPNERLSVDPHSSDTSNYSHLSYILISKRTAFQQLISSQSLHLILFTMIHKSRNIFVLTTARDFLAYLGDNETGNRYLSIFTLITPASIIGVPLVDYILRHYGHHGGFQFVNLLGIIHGLITVTSSSLNIQIVGFVIFSFYRCFLFTVIFSFGPTFLGSDVIGRGAGLMIFVAGLFSFVNIPLKNWAISHLDGNFQGPNLLYLCSILPCIFGAWRMGEGTKAEKRAKERELIIPKETNSNNTA